MEELIVRTSTSYKFVASVKWKYDWRIFFAVYSVLQVTTELYITYFSKSPQQNFTFLSSVQEMTHMKKLVEIAKTSARTPSKSNVHNSEPDTMAKIKKKQTKNKCRSCPVGLTNFPFSKGYSSRRAKGKFANLKYTKNCWQDPSVPIALHFWEVPGKKSKVRSWWSLGEPVAEKPTVFNLHVTV